MTQFKVTNLSDIVDFSEVTEEGKQKFINDKDSLIQLQDLTFLLKSTQSVLKKKLFTSFVQKLDLNKLKQKFVGKMTGHEMVQIVLEAGFTAAEKFYKGHLQK